MAFANPLPWWGLALVTAAAAALAWHAYRHFVGSRVRRHVLAGIRFVSLMVLVVVVMRPVARLSQPDTQDTLVPILIDSSRSMAIEDVDGRRRIDDARELVTNELLPMLAARFDVEVLSFGEQVVPAEPGSIAATARRSDFAATLTAVRDRYRGRPVAGFVVVSDGADTGAVVDFERTGETLPPVYAVPIGSIEAGGDREVLSVTAAESVLDHSRIDLAVSAIAHGRATGNIELRLLENGRPVEVRHVRPSPDGGPFREVFEIAPPAAAATIYTVEIPPAEGELVPENNTRSVLVQPPVRPRRVLMVEGAPGYEHSFLRRALAADKGLEIDSVVRKGKNEQGIDTYYIQASRGRGQALAAGYPSEAASLFAYDAIVLANVAGDQLTREQMELTRDFVSRRGGGLVVLGAQSFLGRGLAGTPIEDALPVDLSRRVDVALPASTGGSSANRISLTGVGLEHPVTRIGTTLEESRKRWAALPALAASAVIGRSRPGAAILATTAGSSGERPLLAVQRFGEGRSMVFAGEASWRWRMLQPSSDRSYETFWRQTLRWLSLGATDPVTLYPTSSAGAGDELTVRIAVRDPAFAPLRDADVDMRIVGPDGRLREVRASLDPTEGAGGSLYAGRFVPAQTGVHRVTVTVRRGPTVIGTAAGSLLVGGSDLEMADPRVNRALLDRLASATGGRVIGRDQVSLLVDALRVGAPAVALTVHKDLWHNAWSLTLIIGLLAAEWVMRRRWGLR